MGCHLIALGGTGQKALEMLTYACACDALYTLDDDLRRVPVASLSVLTADSDLTPAADAAKRYQALQAVFSAAGLPHVGFHTELQHEHLPVLDPERAGVHLIAGEREQLLTRTLFTEEKTALDARNGLRGHADLGMFFFADALSRLSETIARGEDHPFFSRIRAELDRGEDVKVLLVGSVYGGTGMSGFPSLARFLRGRFPGERLILGAAMLLPAHDPRSVNDYTARAEAALAQYGASGMMRRGPYDPDGLLDAAYLIRMSGNLYAMSYAQTAGSTESDARIQDWLTVKCASQFFSTAFRGEGAEAVGLYHVPRTSHQPSWPCFDDDRAYFRIRFGGLMRAAALHLAECQPEILKSLAGKARTPQYFQPYLRAMRKLGAPERDALEALLQELRRFLSQFVRRMGEAQRLQPPPMPGRAEPDGFFDPRVLQTLQKLLETLETDAEGEPLRRQLRESLPAMVLGGADSTFAVKHLLSLLAKGRKPAVETPAAAFAAYTAALLDCTAQGTAGLPALQLPPPDSRGIDPNHHLLTLARNLPIPDDAPLCDAPDVLARETRLVILLGLPHAMSVKQREVIEWRAMLSILLLWDGWELRHNLPELRCGQPPEGAATRAVLAALPNDRLNAGLTLFTVLKDVDGMVFEGPLGLLSRQTALLPAADPEKLKGLLPDYARWYDPGSGTFSDPCPMLNETDRARLIHRLKCLQILSERADLGSPLQYGNGALGAAADAFLADLQSRGDFWRERFEADDPRAVRQLYIRTLAVFGPAVDGIEKQEEELSLQDLKQNPLMKRLLGEPADGKRGASQSAVFLSEPVTTYYFNGAAFAVDSPRYLLAPVNAEGEQATLDTLEKALEALSSPAFHRQAAKRFLELANRLTSRSGASKKAVSLLRAWSVKHSKMAAETCENPAEPAAKPEAN